MMSDLGFSQIDMGRVFSALLLGYALFQVPSGMLADRWGARRVLLWAAVWWVVGTVLIAGLGFEPFGRATLGALPTLLVLRFFLGVGEAPTFPAAGQGVARWIPPSRQGFANGIVLAAIGSGSAVAPPLLSRVMVRWGWRIALITSAIPALVVAFAWRTVRAPTEAPRLVVSRRIRETGGQSLWSRSFVLLTLSYTLEGYVAYIFIFWFYLYLVQVRHFDLLRAGLLSSLPWILSMISIPIGGVISDRLMTGTLGRRWGRRAIPVIGLGFSGCFLALGAKTDNAYSAVAYLTLSTALILCVEGPFWATMIDLAGPRSGAAGGVMNLGSNVGGLLSPVLTPILAAHFGWENALFVAAAISLVGAALWMGISPKTSGKARGQDLSHTRTTGSEV
jgi:ACS family glucarate transporter-like MFS transporter